MEQIGPSTHEFAEARRLSRAVGDEILTKLIEETGMTNDQVRASIIMIGLPTMDVMRAALEKRFPDLTLDYVRMLDELNDMKVKKDNDLPPTKEKG